MVSLYKYRKMGPSQGRYKPFEVAVFIHQKAPRINKKGKILFIGIF